MTYRHVFIKGRRTAERLKAAGLIALLFLAYGIVGTSDYEDAVAADQHYTEMVCAVRDPDLFASIARKCGFQIV